MATELFYFSGTAKWAHVQKPNKFGKLSINLYVDDKTRKEIRGTGMRRNAKEDDDGFFYSFTRDPERTFSDGSKIAPMPVLDKEGNPFTGLIGNGSKVTIKVAVYDFPAGTDDNGQPYAAGKGSRLEAVRIDELVEYTKETEGETESGPAISPRAQNAPKGLPF